MNTFVVVKFTHPLELVTVNVYVPALVFCATAITGFCALEEYPNGPVHVYVVPPLPVKFNGCPKHTGELLVAVGVGNAFMVMDAVPALVQLPTVTVSV